MQLKNMNLILGMLVFSFLFCMGCEDPITPAEPMSSEKEITSFVFDSLAIPALADIDGNIISVQVPYGTDCSRLIARFSYNGKGVYVNDVLQESGITENDYSSSVRFRVQAEDGSSRQYLVVVEIATASENRLQSFVLSDSDNDYPCKIESDSVAVNIPPTSDISNLTVSFSTPGKNVYIGGVPQINGISCLDFSIVDRIQVEAYDGSIRTYTFVLSLKYPKEMLSFTFTQFNPPVEAEISGQKITAKIPDGSSLRALIPEFTYHGKNVYINEVLQESGVSIVDFSGPITYRVKAEDGSSIYYEVTVDNRDSKKEIAEFVFEDFSPDIHASVLVDTILLRFPANADITNLIPTIDARGVEILVNGIPVINGVSAFDFSEPVGFTVIAADGSKKEYTATTQTDDLFVTVWDYSYSWQSTDITFPLDPAGTYDFVIDWGDGTVEHVSDASSGLNHTYALNKVYEIVVEGTIDGFGTSEGNALGNLVDIKSWGDMKFHDNGYQLYGSSISELSVAVAPNLSTLTNMKSFFAYCSVFNSDISSWNVTHVTNMNSLFEGAKKFNQNIGSWDTSKVTNMAKMFKNAESFNQNIGLWNTAKVIDMQELFLGAVSFDQNIGSWDTSSVENMSYMFAGYNFFTDYNTIFNQDLSEWNTGSVKNMKGMFEMNLHFNGDISSWNVSNVSDMSYMFSDAKKFNRDISKWDTGSVMNMSSMFNSAENFDGEISQWNTGAVSDMSYMFYGALSFKGNISSWDTGSVTNMSYMFSKAKTFNSDISKWNTSSVEDMSYMFEDAILFNHDLTLWNVEKVGDFSYMFQNAIAFNGDLSAWKLKSANFLKGMFLGATSFNQPIVNWNVASVGSFEGMFWGATSFNQPVPLQTTNAKNMGYMFAGAVAFNQDLSLLETSQVTQMHNMFAGATAFNQNLTSWNVENVTNMQNMFKDATSFNGDLSGWKLTNVTSVQSMFEGASAFDQPLNSWDVSNVETFWDMFKDASTFNQPLHNWITSSATDMEGVFMNAAAFNQDISDWDTSRVEFMEEMFSGALSFNQDLTPWDVHLIASEPLDFAAFSVLLPENYPVWGTTGVPPTP